MKFVFAKFDLSLVHIGIIVGVGSSFPLISRFIKGVFVEGFSAPHHHRNLVTRVCVGPVFRLGPSSSVGFHQIRDHIDDSLWLSLAGPVTQSI